MKKKFQTSFAKTQTTVITKANRSEVRHRQKPMRAQSRNRPNCIKRGETRVFKPGLVLVLNLIG